MCEKHKAMKKYRGNWNEEILRFEYINVKENDYYTTDPHMETSIYDKIISRNQFRQILPSLHFCDNNTMAVDPSLLFIV